MYEIYCKLREIKIHHTTIAKGTSKEIKSFPKHFFQNGFNFNREICFNKEAGGKSCFFSFFEGRGKSRFRRSQPTKRALT